MTYIGIVLFPFLFNRSIEIKRFVLVQVCVFVVFAHYVISVYYRVYYSLAVEDYIKSM